MELTGQLYNLSKSLQIILSLPLPASSEKSARVVKSLVRQRRLGDVRDAMIAVLSEQDESLRVAEIYERVQQKLEGPVSYQHLKDFLSHRSRGEKQLFEREGWGRYRLWSPPGPAEGASFVPRG